MSTELWERILYIFGGMFVGILLALVLDAKSIRSMIKIGYNRAVQDILNNHVYCDKNDRWHQLSLTWRDLSK